MSAYASMITDAALDSTILTSRSLGTLHRIRTNPGATVSELARGAPITQQALSQTVARLEKLGLVERRPRQGRRHELYVTPQGSAAIVNGDECERSAEHHMRQSLSDDAYAELVKLLELARECFIER